MHLAPFLKASLFSLSVIARPTDPNLSTFEQITPSKILTWTPCYAEEFLCAKLNVPLDYNRPAGLPASLPLIKVSAQVNSTDGPYQGMLLFNPGGPGHSGVATFLQGLGKILQEIPGTNWDLVTFDPRGVGYATPSANCSSPADPRLDRRSMERLTAPELDAGFFNMSFEEAQKTGEECQQKIGGDDQIGTHMTAASVVTDMLMINEAFQNTEQGKQAPTSDLVNFWGFSYGTFLGMTFASMYPDKVGRMVLDGHADPDDIVSGLDLKSITSCDDVFSNFLRFCHLAEPGKCSFATGNSTDDIYNRFEKLLWKIDPKEALARKWKNASDISQSLDLFQLLITTNVYNPNLGFPLIADTLVAWERVVETNFSAKAMAAAQAQVAGPAVTYPGYMAYRNEWNLAIACTEADSNYDQSKESLQQYIDEVQSQQESILMGGEFAKGRISCARWPIVADWRFTGPFEATTKTPMQFMGSTFDPATPLKNAEDNLQRFNGSKLITVDGLGHTTFVAYNLCAQQAQRSYFQTGQPTEKFCDFETGPWNVTGAGPLYGQGYYSYSLGGKMR